MFQILIADDEALIRRGLTAILQRGLEEEIRWLEAANGQEALELVEQNDVDLIITDICMPLCSGFGICRKAAAGAGKYDGHYHFRLCKF